VPSSNLIQKKLKALNEMDFQKVIETEKNFKETGFKGEFKLTTALLPVRNEPNLQLKVVSCVPSDGHTSYYYTEKFEKKQILLHFTMGHLQGDIFTLTKEDTHVSVPYVIARDGLVYRLFGSEFWSYHIGQNELGSNGTFSKSSIALEISNYGPLTLVGEELKTAYGDTYCTLDDVGQYVKLEKKYRDSQYYATYTDAQYEAVIVLLRYLTAAYGIKRAFLPEALRFVTTSKVVGFDGIVSHVNYREDKCDIGPAFDWARVIKGVTAEKFTTFFLNAPTGTREVLPILKSERSLDPPSYYRRRKIVSDSHPEPLF
jgi:N-acetylmuramoyl-L-alanine amidase